jgi:hypothetical protein
MAYACEKFRDEHYALIEKIQLSLRQYLGDSLTIRPLRDSTQAFNAQTRLNEYASLGKRDWSGRELVNMIQTAVTFEGCHVAKSALYHYNCAEREAMGLSYHAVRIPLLGKLALFYAAGLDRRGALDWMWMHARSAQANLELRDLQAAAEDLRACEGLDNSSRHASGIAPYQKTRSKLRRIQREKIIL